jgi:hypothetical protein
MQIYHEGHVYQSYLQSSGKYVHNGKIHAKIPYICICRTYGENKLAMFQRLSRQTLEPPERNMPARLQNQYSAGVVKRKTMFTFTNQGHAK